MEPAPGPEPAPDPRSHEIAQPRARGVDTGRMTNKIVAFVLAAAAGCGSVMSPPHGSGGGDDDTGSNGSGSDEGPPPPPATPLTFYGAIKDERNDQIAFVNGSPVHTHTGAATQIQGNGDCPAIYKYAYLTDRTPKFGREATANPLAFLIQGNDTVDPGASSFQVRTEDNRVLVAWKDMTPDADNIYTLTLNRDDGAELGTYVGKLYVDARFHDSSGAETIKTQCFENHPLQAPLQVAAPERATLFGLSLTNHSAISPLLNGGAGIDVEDVAIVQNTGETLDISFDFTAAVGSSSIGTFDEYVVTTVTPYTIVSAPVCSGTLPCDIAYVPPATQTSTLTQPQGGALVERLVDDTTHETICTGTSNLRCTIPARGLNDSPHGYHLIIADSSEKSLWPATGPFGDYQVTNTFFATGVEYAPAMQCTKPSARTVNNIEYDICREVTTYVRVIGLASASTNFGAMSFAAKSNVGEPAIPTLSAGALTFPAVTWDGGSRT